MNDVIPWSDVSEAPLNQPVRLQAVGLKAAERKRLMYAVFWQIVFASLAAFISQLLIFDEANWYKIDLYDALTWGLVVTQVFTLTVYVSRCRIQTVENSLRVFMCMGALAAGLTVAAITFLVIDAVQNGREVWSLLGISVGYWVAVFVFLVAMFLQLRLIIICLQASRSLFAPKRSPKSDSIEMSAQIEPTAPESDSEPSEKYSIADIFAFTGLAAVSISAYRLVLGMVTDYDAIRFLAMFYAASMVVFCIYGSIQLPIARFLKLILIVVIVLAFAYAEFNLAQWIRSPLLRFGFGGMLLCNCVLALATTLQCLFLEKFAPLSHPTYPAHPGQ